MQEGFEAEVQPVRRRRSAKYQTAASPAQIEVQEEKLEIPKSTPAKEIVQLKDVEEEKIQTPENKQERKVPVRSETKTKERTSTKETADKDEGTSYRSQLGTRGYVPEKIPDANHSQQKKTQTGSMQRTQTGSMQKTQTGSVPSQTGNIKQQTAPQRVSNGYPASQVMPRQQTGSMQPQTMTRNQTGPMPQANGRGQTGGMVPNARQNSGPMQVNGYPGYSYNGMPVQTSSGGQGQSPYGNGQMPRTGGYYPVQPQGPARPMQQGANAGYPGAPAQSTMQTGRGSSGQAPQRTNTQPRTSSSGSVPPIVPPVKKTDDDASNKKTPKQTSTTQKILRILIIVVLAAVLIYFGITTLQKRQAERALQESVTAYDNYFVDGVFVDGIALGGMTFDQALATVRENAQKRSDAWSVRLTYEDTVIREITAADLNITVDVQDTMNSAWQQGHTGTIEERRNAMDQLLVTPYEAYTANPGGDQSRLNEILQALGNLIYQAPQDASIASFNAGLTYPFTFNEEVIGRSLDIDALRTEIYHSLSAMESQDIELNILTTEPEVTVDWIKANLLEERGFGSTPITTHSTENRNENIRVAFSKVTGTVLQPGDQFSFNDIVGQRTEKNGFLPAIEYAYGEVSDGIGGGVCQASTTIYLAAVRAGMQIIKREPHSDAVNYISYGKDATVYWYSNHKIDLVFKNPTDHPIYITAAVQSDRQQRTKLVCNVRIYGETLNGITYDIVTEETEIDAPMEPEYVKDKKGEYVTYTDEEKVVRQASKGCEVVSYRVAYQDGVEIERKYLYTDTYKPKAERIYVGVTPR